MLRNIFAKPVQVVLDRLGYSLNKKAAAVVPLTALEAPVQALYEKGDIAFSVPLDKCRSLLHFSYHPAGWHPFVRLLEQYRSDPELTYQTSLLYDFYKAYRPETLFELFLGHLPEAGLEAAPPLAGLSLKDYYPFFPWDARERRPHGEYGLGAAHGHQAFGPVSAEKGELEFKRLTGAYESIKKLGYQPRPGRDGEIRGFFLKTGDDYRFIVRQGLHRTPALAVLGHEQLRVKFSVGLPRAIFLAELEHWPQVRSGLMAKDIAEKIFRLFFEDDGRRKARYLGFQSAPRQGARGEGGRPTSRQT